MERQQRGGGGEGTGWGSEKDHVHAGLRLVDPSSTGDSANVGQHVIAVQPINVGETVVRAEGWRFNTETKDSLAFLRFIGQCLKSEDEATRHASERLAEGFRDACPRVQRQDNPEPVADPLLSWVPDVDLYIKKLSQNSFDQGFFPAACKLNHSCSPNAEGVCLSKADGVALFEVKATRPIAAGEEVCISYLGITQLALPTDQRRTLLQPGYEFTCMCQRCVDEDSGSINATTACNVLCDMSPCCGSGLAAMQDCYVCAACQQRHAECASADQRLTTAFREAAAAAHAPAVADIVRSYNRLSVGLHGMHWICASLRTRLLQHIHEQQQSVRSGTAATTSTATTTSTSSTSSTSSTETLARVVLEAVTRSRQLSLCDVLLGEHAATSVGACDSAAQSWLAARTLLMERLQGRGGATTDGRGNTQTGESQVQQQQQQQQQHDGHDNQATAPARFNAWIEGPALPEPHAIVRAIEGDELAGTQQLHAWLTQQHERMVQSAVARRGAVIWPAA